MSRFTVSSRSKWKGPYSKIIFTADRRLARLRFMQIQSGKSKPIFRFKSRVLLHVFLRLCHTRSSVILKKHIGKIYLSYNGKFYSKLQVTSGHVGHRLGEFTRTTRRGSSIHKNNAKSKKLKSKK